MSKSFKEVLAAVAANDDTMDTLDTSAFNGTLNSGQVNELFTALKENTVITSCKMEKLGFGDVSAVVLAEVLATNASITYLDIGYNNIGGVGMKAYAKAMLSNSTLVECKLHRQDKEMGTAAENEVVALWTTNTTLTRQYVTLHDRRCNTVNTKGEVRNKTIAALIKAGKNWDHLDPSKEAENRLKRDAAKAEKDKADLEKNAPITEQVESTGGPYTLKQLTCAIKFQPADLDKSDKPKYLSDDDFTSVFKMTREEFGALAGWKQKNVKKKHNLH